MKLPIQIGEQAQVRAYLPDLVVLPNGSAGDTVYTGVYSRRARYNSAVTAEDFHTARQATTHTH